MQRDEMSGHVCFGRVQHGDATMCSLHVCERLAVLRSIDLSLSRSLGCLVSRCMLSSNDFGSCSETTRTVSSVRALVSWHLSDFLHRAWFRSRDSPAGATSACQIGIAFIFMLLLTPATMRPTIIWETWYEAVWRATNDEDQTSQETRSSSSEDFACEHRY